MAWVNKKMQDWRCPIVVKTRTNIQYSLYKLAHIRVAHNDALPPWFSVPPAVVERDSVVQHVSRMEKEEEEEVTIQLQLKYFKTGISLSNLMDGHHPDSLGAVLEL